MASASSTPPAPRVAVVTGATSGIGREVARGLAATGWTTVVVGRGADRTARTASELARETGNPRVETLAVEDLALLGEMKRVALELLRRFPAIHLLINNAGAYFARRDETADGLERTFALNVLAPFTLTSLLAERLVESAPARVVQVASEAHRGNTVDLSDLQGARAFSGYAAYGRSKLELVLLTREFARRLAGRGVTVNAVHPGFIRSGFGENNPGGTAFGIRLAKWLFARSVRHGAGNELFVATDPSVTSISGEYFSGQRVVAGSAPSRDMGLAGKLFGVCSQLAGIEEVRDPGPLLASPSPPATAPRSAAST